MLSIILAVDFSKIENIIKEKEIALPQHCKEELSKRFDLSNTRNTLINNIIEPLEFFKHSKIFKNSSKGIQEVIDKIGTSIRIFGLSKDVKEIVIKAESDLGVKLNLPDSSDLAKYIYKNLSVHKKLGYALPKEISFNDFDFFTQHNPALSANYISGTKPKEYDEIIAKYPSLTETFNKKKIDFNPAFLLLRQDKKDYIAIFEDLRHELGHFWHNLKIGDEVFHSKEMNSIDGFLSSDDISFFVTLKNSLMEKACFINDLNFELEENQDLSKIIPDLQKIIKNRDGLNLKNVITDDVIDKFNQIINKLGKITNITLKQFADCPEEAVYALTSPKELVAFSIQKSHNHEYNKDFLNILKKFSAPEVKEQKISL